MLKPCFTSASRAQGLVSQTDGEGHCRGREDKDDESRYRGEKKVRRRMTLMRRMKTAKRRWLAGSGEEGGEVEEEKEEEGQKLTFTMLNSHSNQQLFIKAMFWAQWIITWNHFCMQDEFHWVLAKLQRQIRAGIYNNPNLGSQHRQWVLHSPLTVKKQNWYFGDLLMSTPGCNMHTNRCTCQKILISISLFLSHQPHWDLVAKSTTATWMATRPYPAFLPLNFAFIWISLLACLIMILFSAPLCQI